MKRYALKSIGAIALLCVSTAVVSAQTPVAGGSAVGVSVTEMANIVAGWSAKKHILGQTVYNDAKDSIGTVDDIIISPDKTVTYARIGAGGFLGMGKHDVAVPVRQFTMTNGKLVLPGATKDALKAMPEFQYAK